MAPDFPYFILLTDITRFGHTLPGLFLFCLPAGFAVLFAFHRFVKQPLLSISPESLRTRVGADHPFAFLPAGRLFWLAVSILLGAVTHILWDGFTHRSELFVNAIPLLRASTLANQPLYNVLQHVSSVVGLIILGAAYMRWANRTPACAAAAVPPLDRRLRTLILGFGSSVALAFGLLFAYDRAQLHTSTWLSVFVVRAVIGSMAAGSLAIAVFSLWWNLYKKEVPELQEVRER